MLDGDEPIWEKYDSDTGKGNNTGNFSWSAAGILKLVHKESGALTAAASDKCLDVAGGNPADGTPVQLYGCNGTAAQTWSLPGDGTVRALGKCLDVKNGSTAPNTPVQLYGCNGTGAQDWKPGTGQTLVNGKSGLCLDVENGGTADGTRVLIHKCHNGTNQNWNLPG
ncbi:RICIN domain-containing protein [Streptomyces sp. NA04227]|nr:RICIN domain-containing protein [Streptomyces sp. NA04227]